MELKAISFGHKSEPEAKNNYCFAYLTWGQPDGYQEVIARGAEADQLLSNAEVKNACSYRGRSLTHELWEGVANSVPLPPPPVSPHRTFAVCGLQALIVARSGCQGLHLMESRTRLDCGMRLAQCPSDG